MATERELLSRYDCGATDDKARRVLNVSGQVANITAAEIEAGVTLERLQSLNVPVFRYHTQITIHGQLPDFDTSIKQNGYKSVFRNGNGSIGVRYVAIDAEKKRTLTHAAQHTAKPATLAALMDSQGLQLQHLFGDKAEAVAAAEELRGLAPLFIGNVACFTVSMFGIIRGYAVVATISAIPADSLWPLISALYGITSAEELAQLITTAEAKRKAESEAYAAKRQQERAELEAKSTAALDAIKAKLIADGRKQLSAVPLPGRFVEVFDSFTRGPGAYVRTVQTGPFKRLLLGDPNKGKRHAVTDAHRRAWARAAKEGRIFAALDA
jgi:hypothetical protein